MEKTGVRLNWKLEIPENCTVQKYVVAYKEISKTLRLDFLELYLNFTAEDGTKIVLNGVKTFHLSLKFKIRFFLLDFNFFGRPGNRCSKKLHRPNLWTF